MKRAVLVFLLLWLYMPSIGFAQGQPPEGVRQGPQLGWFYGAGLMVSEKYYMGSGARILPIPLIGYKGERLNIYGPFVRYDVIQEDSVTVDIRLAPRFDGFDIDDSIIFNGMTERKWSIDGGVGVQFRVDNWKLSNTVVFDILSRSKGLEASTAISYVFRDRGLSIEPRVGIRWQDANMIDYYYGVQAGEATNPRPQFTGKSSWIVEAGVTLANSFDWGRGQMQMSHEWVDDAVFNSPLVDKNKAFKLMINLSRYF